MTTAYERYCRPLIGRSLHALGLDVTYERAEGDSLWMRRDNKMLEIRDFVGGFGGSLFGHNHPVIVAEAQRLLAEKT